METLIAHPDNPEKLNALKAVMKALNIRFDIAQNEEELDQALGEAMEEGRKTALLSEAETKAFLETLKNAK